SEPEPDARGRAQGVGWADPAADTGAFPDRGDGRGAQGTGPAEQVADPEPGPDRSHRRGPEGVDRADQVALAEPSGPGERWVHSRTSKGLTPGHHYREPAALHDVKGTLMGRPGCVIAVRPSGPRQDRCP